MKRFHLLDFAGLAALLALIACGPPPVADPPTVPMVDTPTTANITGTTATLGGNVSNDGDLAITDRGVVFCLTATNFDPKIGDTDVDMLSAGPGAGTTGPFTVNATGLTAGKDYVFKAYATNSAGTGYGSATGFTTVAPPSGLPDTGYTPNPTGLAVYASAVQPDGMTIIGGNFTMIGGEAHMNLARLAEDGTVDSGFTPSADFPVACVAVQDDGKILIGGDFTFVNGTGRNHIARLNPDGTLDGTFNPGPGTGANNSVFSVVLQPDGQILIGGHFTQVNGTLRNNLARLNPDGSLENPATFDPGADFSYASPLMSGTVWSIALQADGKILVGGGFDRVNGLPGHDNLVRLNADGTVDFFFPAGTEAGSTIYSVVVPPDGRILIGGNFTQVSGTPKHNLARLDPVNGSLEFTFNPGTGPDDLVNSIVVQADGKILIGGFFEHVNATTRNNIARLNATDGSLETAFDPGPGLGLWVYSVALQANGTILLGGEDTGLTPNNILGRLSNSTPTQTLTTTGVTQVQWMRGGSAPEVSSVSFDLSTDGGTSWTPLGAGTHIVGGWRLTGLSLPADGLVRARGRTTSGSNNGSSGLVEQVMSILGKPVMLAGAPTKANISDTSATLGGCPINDGGTPITERGVVYSVTATNPTPEITGLDVTKVPTSGTLGTFTVNVTSLTMGENYSFRAYATNSEGTTYSITNSFTTLAPPTVTTPIGSGITTNSATLGGNVENDGGSPITERGVVFNTGVETEADRLVSNSDLHKITTNPATGIFTVNATGLTPGADYSYAAYATNSVGTTYSALGHFSTPAAAGANNSLAGSNPLGRAVTTGSGAASPRTSGITPRALSGGSSSGALETAYNPNVNGSLQGAFVQATAVQTDGKTVIGGFFTTAGGAAHANLARLNVDGSVEAAFTTGTNGGIFSVALQADGKILIAGAFNAVNTAARNFLARLNPDGSLESTTTFNPGSGPDGVVYSVAVQPDGKILLGGLFTKVNGIARNNIARLNPDGSLESTATFNPGTGTDDAIYNVAVQPDGKILLGGAFIAVNGQTRNRIARLNGDGSLEGTGTFNPGTGANNRVASVALQADGKILLGGYFTTVNGAARNHLARLNADGSLESTATFNPGTGADNNVLSLAVQTDGKILLGGTFQNVNGSPRHRIARLQANGTLEGTGTFDSGSGANGEIDSVAVQADGKILLGGAFTAVDGTTRNLIARLTNDAATQRLTASDTTRVQWLRGGAGPEVAPVTFELSTNGGVNWTALGTGTRIAGGWQLTGLSLPNNGSLRARGRTAGGYVNGSAGLVEQVATFAMGAPVVTSPTSTAITATGATLGGNVTNAGTTAITERGVVYAPTATNADPQIGGAGVTKLTASGTTGVFTVDATGLTVGTAYSFNAYATNSVGTTYTAPAATFATVGNNANLASLVLTTATLSPAFASDTLSYTSNVPNETTTITVTPTVAQAGATVKVNDATVTSGSASAGIPLSEGDNTITVVVTAQDGTTTKTYTVAVFRVVSPPDIAVEQPVGTNLPNGGAISFGSFSAGNTPPSKTVTVSNPGTANLTGLALSKDGTNAADFVIDDSGMSTTLAPGASATFTVTFRPGVAGTKTATIHLANNVPGKDPYDIALSGTAGPLPDIAIEVPKGAAMAAGGTKNFGTAALKKKITATFVVKNTGAVPLTGTTVTVSGANASEFHVTAKLTAPIKPGKSKTFKVVFAPVSGGPKSAQLQITSNDPDESPYLVNLTGSGPALALAAASPRLNRETTNGSVAATGPVSNPGVQTSPNPAQPAASNEPGTATATPTHVDLAGTTWSLPMDSRVSVSGVEVKDGHGNLTLTFDADGGLYLEDDSGVGLWGTYAYDAQGELSAQIFPQGVEDYLRIALGGDVGLGVTVDSPELDLQVANGQDGPSLTALFGFTAWLTYPDPGTHQSVKLELNYDLSASGPRN